MATQGEALHRRLMPIGPWVGQRGLLPFILPEILPPEASCGEDRACRQTYLSLVLACFAHGAHLDFPDHFLRASSSELKMRNRCEKRVFIDHAVEIFKEERQCLALV